MGSYTSTVNGTATTYIYEYDSKGNITKIVSGNKEIRYVYDDLGQLLREDNGLLNETYVYTYDSAGNITSKKTYALTAASVTPTSPVYTDTYSYGDSSWGDKLTSYNGSTITYDSIGNPIYYRSDELYEFEWEGRKLVSAEIGDEEYTTVAFTYNDDGLRTSKTVDGVTTTYYYNGDLLVAQEIDTLLMVFMYDASGSPIGFMYRYSSYAVNEWIIYWYEKNLQGDIVAIYDSEGTLCISYIYDAWGNCRASYESGYITSVARLNPFRYRGYYYDDDLKLYYLQSRYYDPNTCRFINADGQLNTDHILGANLYAYCYNNPVMYVDHTGCEPDWWLLFEGSVFVFMGVVTVAAVLGTGGSCLPLVQLAYLGLIAAGVTVTSIGASEIYEFFTGYNPVKDDVGEQAYDTLKYGSLFVMSMGSSIIEYGTAASVCFVAETIVKASEGDVLIENIQVGDYVYAHNPETGETELKPVVNTLVNEATELVHVFTDGEEIICTNEHPFYSPVKGWIAACKLRAGDILVSLNGEYIVVEQVQHEILEAPIKVYNFEVEDFHTYFVGDGYGVLVHNACSDNNYMSKREINKIKSDISAGRDVTFNSKQDAINFINNNYSFPQETAGQRSANGWHFDAHEINGVYTEHINLYSKSGGFRIHIFWEGE